MYESRSANVPSDFNKNTCESMESVISDLTNLAFLFWGRKKNDRSLLAVDSRYP